MADEDDRRVLVALSALVADRTARAAADLGAAVSVGQLGLISGLHRDGPATMSVLAVAARVAVSTASRWVDRLQGLGLVVRRSSDQDRRDVVVGLTARGRALGDRWDQARVEVWDDLLAPMTAEQRRKVLTELDVAITAAPGAAAVDPPVGDRSVADRPVRSYTDPGRAGWQLHTQLLTCSPDAAAGLVVEAVREQAQVDQVVLRVVTLDGRFLRPAAWTAAAPAGRAGHAVGFDRTAAASRATGTAVGGDATPSGETVDRSPAGQALRSQQPVVEPAGDGHVVHVPVTAADLRIGVLSATVATAAGSERVALVEALASAATPFLAAGASSGRQVRLAARVREWTIAAEVQARQLGPRRTVAHGVHVAAHVEPAFDGCTDSYDVEVVAGPTGPVLDVAVFDARVDRHDAPLITGLALGALRHARTLGLDLADQAGMVDQALFGYFRGDGVVDFLLLRCTVTPWSIVAVASGGIDLLIQRPALTRYRLPEHDTAGLTGEARYRAGRIDVDRGHRLIVLGDGFARASAAGAQAERVIERSGDVDADELVRLVTADLLDRTGADGPADDATIVCLDT